jgi:hypothetical protein
MKLRAGFLTALLLIAAGASHAENLIYFYSEEGDYIGGGQERWFTDADGSFAINSSFFVPFNGGTVYFDGNQPVTWWDLDFRAPDNDVLVPGFYPNAQRAAFADPGHPGIDFGGSGRGCNTITGEFTVLDIAFDGAGEPYRVAIDFVQHCEGFTPALRGKVRFNTGIPTFDWNDVTPAHGFETGNLTGWTTNGWTATASAAHQGSYGSQATGNYWLHADLQPADVSLLRVFSIAMRAPNGPPFAVVDLIYAGGTYDEIQLHPGTAWTRMDLLPVLRDSGQLVGVTFWGSGGSSSNLVQLDDVVIGVYTGQMFSDGFESGDTTRWNPSP